MVEVRGSYLYGQLNELREVLNLNFISKNHLGAILWRFFMKYQATFLEGLSIHLFSNASMGSIETYNKHTLTKG